MALLRVNPTRMELRRLKLRLKTAIRGHKLLKDKSDEMIRQFMVYVKENKALREDVEEDSTVVKGFYAGEIRIRRRRNLRGGNDAHKDQRGIKDFSRML